MQWKSFSQSRVGHSPNILRSRDQVMHDTEFEDFAFLCYHIHSLMNSEERIDWLLEELGEQRWDMIVFTETGAMSV